MVSIPSAGKAPNFRALFQRLSLRHFQEEPVRFLVTILGIALGIALMVAIHLANGAAINSFHESIDLMAGKANLSLSSPSSPLTEKILEDLVETRRFGQMLPVIQGKMTQKDSPREFLTVLGVDLFKDADSRDYKVLGPEGKTLTPSDLLKLIPRTDTVFLTQKYADAKGIVVGQQVDFLVNDHTQTLQVAGLLSEGGVGRALDGTLALMDIAAAQKVFGKIGSIDRLEWIIPKPAERETLEAQLRKLYPSYKIDRPARRGDQIEKMLAAFRANLLALSLVSILVGAFLVYNSMSIAVLRRVEEIGVLRTLGVTRPQIVLWVLAEALLMSVAGVILGLVLGKILAFDVLRVIGKTIQNLYLPMPLEARLPGLAFAWEWILFGVVLIVAAAVPPALSTVRIEPGLSVRKGHTVVVFERKLWILTTLGLAAWGLAAFLSTRPAWHGLPVFGFGAAFLLLLGLVFLTPFFLSRFFGVLGKLLRFALPSEAFLAFRNLLSDLSRSSVALGALVMSVALMVSVAVMVGSFRQTVVIWLGETLKADIYVRPAVDASGPMESLLDPRTLKALGQVPGVKAIEKLRSVPIAWRDGEVSLNAVDMDVQSREGSVVFKTPGDARALVQSVLAKPAVFISEPMALKFGLKAGDRIALPAAAGPVSVPIKAVYYDYSNDRGTIMMDRAVYSELFRDDSVNGAALYLQPGFSSEQVHQDILKRLPEGTQVFLQSTAELRDGAMRVFDQTFAITYGVEAIALILAVMGILTTLTALILERRQEIVILRYIGAPRRQVTRMILWEAGWIGFLGNLMGFGGGLALALLLIDVINVQSFGWTIQWHIPWGFLGWALGLVFATTLGAGFFPAKLADGLPAMREVTKE